MDFETALEAYYFRNKSLSEQTQEYYAKQLNAFTAWCKAHGYTELEELSPKIVRTYIDEIAARPHPYTKKPLSSHTVHSHARAIRAFLNWLEMDEDFEEHVQRKIGKRIPMPRLQKKVVNIFSMDEIKRLFEACEGESWSWPELVARDKAILAMLLDTGVRSGELVGLTLDNCFLADRQPYIKVVGKGFKEREVGLGKLSLAALENYLQHYRLAKKPDSSARHILAHVPKSEQHVFVGLQYEPFTADGLKRMLYRLGKRAGVKNVHPHKFRHSMACYYLMNDAGDLHSLSKLLGHSDIMITSNVYLSAVQAMQARLKSKSVLDDLL